MGIHIGTSGYSYAHWRGRLYPRGIAQQGWLEYYASRFDSVELNAPFYRLPSAASAEAWRRATPPQFRFAVKGSRSITHVARLRDSAEALGTLAERLRGMGPKLAVMLWQLPGSFHCDLPRLRAFLIALDCFPSHVRHALEVRHGSWLVSGLMDLLRERNVALCQSDWRECPVSTPRTADFLYVRRHGWGRRYAGSYPEHELERLAAVAENARNAGCDAFIYFNNDAQAFAAENAGRLAEMLGLAPPAQLHPQFLA